jgi:hypothetical protein
MQATELTHRKIIEQPLKFAKQKNLHSLDKIETDN